LKRRERTSPQRPHQISAISCGITARAKELVTEHLNNNQNSFTDTEKETLTRVAGSLHPDNENHREATKALEFITSTNRLYRNMKEGHHFTDFPMTDLLKRYEK
jgi:hypothetical protein